MGKVILKKDRQRIELSEAEIYALKWLFDHRALTVAQYYFVTSTFFRHHISEYAFKNRLRKMEEFKLIRSGKHTDGFEGDRFKYLLIGSRGIDILKQEKRIKDDYDKKKIYTFGSKVNHYHFFATQEVVIRFIAHYYSKEGVSREKRLKIRSIPSSSLPYTYSVSRSKPSARSPYGYTNRHYSYDNKPKQELPSHVDVTICKPDWILKAENLVCNIELDTGSEPVHELAMKVYSYLRVAKGYDQFQHQLLIVLPDETFLKKQKFGNRTKRIENIYEQFRKEGLMEKAAEVNLTINVCSLKHAAAVITKFFHP